MSGEGAQRLALALVLLVSLLAPLVTAAPLSETTEMDVYDGEAGCYYNFQHYGEGDRIMTNEPCLNCTCHNRMLMCYLRVCPFTKPIGQDCTVEKRGDQCCPVITCPDVPVDLLTSTTQSPVDSTEVGHHDNYGCSIDDKFYSDGAQVPSNSNKPCELCYCIRNMTTCVMQECTLHVEGCTPVYNRGVCCPVRYSCDHPDEDGPLMIDDMTTTVKPTPGFMLTTTLAPGFTMECTHDDEVYADGALITTDKACEHCYCMKGDIVCIVQGCGTPMENEGKNCTAVAPKADQCCPETYVCDGDESPTTSMGDANVLTTTHSPKDEESEVQKPEIEGDTEKHTPESEHTTEVDSATDKQKPESSTNIPQTDSITITESEKATPYVTEQDQLETESSTEHVPKVSTSTESSTPHVETETVYGKPESDTSTDTQKVEAESATDKQKPDSESITDKHKLESESATDKHELDLESVTDKHILSPESATDKHTPESETDKQKLDSESVTDKREPESTTDKQEQDLESITDKQEPDSEASVTDKHRPESATDKLDSDLESVTDKHKPELESVTDKQATDSESVTDKQGQDLESITHKQEPESVTDKHIPESATDKQDSESVTDKHKPKLESATDKQVPDLESVTDKQEPDSESVTDHQPESATDKQDSETVTDKHKSELESVTDKQSPDSESATDKQELDSESVTDKHQPESATDKQESDLESVTDKHKPDLVSTTESKKTSSQDSTEKVKSDSIDTTTEKQHIESDGYTEKTSGLEITTQIPRVEGATEAHEPSLEIDQSTQTLEYESVTKTKGPELEISTIKQDLETEHTPTRKPEHDEHTTIKQSDEDSVTEEKTPELDNEIEEDKTGLGDRFDEHISESDSTTEVQKLEPEQATENLIPETVTSAEKQKPESDSQLEQKPETDHKNATSKPKLDDDIEHKPALDKIDEKPQLESDHDKKTELGQEVSKKPDSEEEDDGQKLETDEESGEQKPAVEQDSVEQIVELEYGTKPSIEHGTKAHTPQPEDEITTHSLEIDEQKHISESTTEFEKLDMDNIHKSQTPQITDEDEQHTGQKDDAHKAEESTEDQSSESYTHKPHLEDRTTIASDDQSILTTVPSIISEIEEKTTVQSSDIEHVTETNVPRVTKISDADEQTIAEGIETVTPVRDYKDDGITDENVPKHDAATKVPQHRDEHEPEYTPTDKDQSFEGTTKTSLVTDKTISATEIIDTDDKVITTENVLEEGHVDETLPVVTDSIESQVTTVKYQQPEEKLTTTYDEKISQTEKPHKQDVGLATDLPSITEKESSSKLPLDSATETYQTTTHKDLYDTKGDTTDETEVEKTTHHPDSQEKEKLPHDVTEEIESESPTTVDGFDVVHRVTESSLDIGHEGSGSESPEITDEISESSTKIPIFTPTSSDVTEGPKDTDTDYTKYPIIDSYSEIPDSHTEVSKDKTPTTVASSQTTKSSITDESPEIESQTLDSQQIDDVFSFTTVQPISDSTDSIHDRYQTDRTDTDNETDKNIESVTKLSTGEKDIKTDDITTIKSDLVHPTKDDIITTVPSIDQHEEGSGDESTTMNTYESEPHTTEKTHVPEISESVPEKEDQTPSLTTEEPITTMKDTSHHDDGEGTTEKTLEKTTVTSSLQTETIKPEHDDKADSSTTDKPVETVTHVHEELTEKPDKLHDEQDSTTPIVHTKLEGDELENEIDEDGRYPEQDHEPPRIPGEGDCLVDGITYKNNSPIPTVNKCQSSCQCVNSILKCDHVQCSPPPADMVNCQPVYHAKDNCCPMYTCEHIEPVTIESDNHMADVTTLAPQETTILSTYTTQSSKDHASDADQDTESNAVDRFQTDKPEDDVSQSTQSPKGSDEQKIIPVFITTDDSKPQEDKDEVHETPIVPSIHIPDCGSNGCSPESKPTSDKPEIGQVTEQSKLDMPETTKKPVGGESTEKDGTLVQPTTVIYDQKTDGDYEQKPISVDIPSDATDTPSTTSPHKEDITHQTSIADEETTSVSKAVRDDLTTVQPETPDDKIDLEDDIGQNTIQPEDDSLLTTTPKFIHSEQTTEKIHLELPGLEEKPIEDSEGTTISPSQDSQESDDTSSEVDADDKKDTTDKPISHRTTEGLLSTKYSGSGYEYSTPINKLLIDDPEITFISTTSKSTETEFTTMVGPFEEKTEHPLDTETETEKTPSVDTSQKLDSEMKTSVKPEIGIDLEEIDDHKEQITTVAYNQEKELTTELSDKKKIPTTELEETVEHKTPGYEYTDKPEESDKIDDIHDEVTTIEAEIDSTSSPVEHENVSSTEQKHDSSVTDAAISHTDQTTIKYADDSSSTKVPVNIDSRDKLTTISPKDDSDIFTIRPVVTETTNLTKPSSEQPDVEKSTESPVTESDIIQTTTKSNIQPTEEEGDNNIVDTEKETDKPLDIVTDSPVEYTTAKLSEITTISSDDVNKIGVSVLPTDTVDEDCGPAGCSQKQPHDTVTSHTPADADSKGDCGLQGCQVEVEFTRVPIEKATVSPTISEECTSEECKLSQTTPPKDVDVPTQCGPEGCEHDDQQNIITDEDDKAECGPNGCTPGSKPHVLPSDDSTEKESDKDGQCGPAGCEQSHEIGEPHVTPSDDSTHKESDKDGKCGDNGCDLTGSEQPHKPTDSSDNSEQCDSPGCTSTKIEQSHEGHPLEPTKESCEGESCSGNQTPKPIDEQQSTSNCKNGVCPSTDDNVIQTDTAQTTVPFADSTPVSGDVVTEIPKDHDLQIGDCGPQGCDSEHEKSTNLPEILTGDTDKATTVSTQDCNGEECSSVKTPEKDEKEKSDIEKPTDITPICESGDCEVLEKSTEIPDTEEVTTTVSKTPAISDKPTKPEESSSDEDITLKSNIDDTTSTPTYNLEKTTEKVIGHQEDCNSPDCLEENQTVTSQPLSEADEQLTTVSHVDVDGHKDVKCDGENCPTDRPVISITESTKTPSVKEDELDIKIPVTTEISTHETLSGIDQHETTIKPSQVDSDTEKSIIGDRFTEDNKATEFDNEITTLQSPADDDHITETGPKVEKEPGSDDDKSVENQTTLSPHEPLETKPHIPSTDIPVSLNPDDFAAVTDKEDDSVQTTEYSVDVPEKHTLSPESHILEKDSDVTTTSPKDSVQHSTEIASTPSDSTDKYPEIENIPVSVDTSELPITKKPSITESGKEPQVTDKQSELMTTESYDQSTLISKHPDTESTTKIDEYHTAHDTHKPDIIDSSKAPEVTDSTHITDVITSTPSSTDLEDNLKTTVPQDEIKQSTDASIKDHSLEAVTSTMIPGEESQQPTDKPQTDVEKSTSISPQEEVTGIPVGQSEEHIPQTSEKESIDSTTLKSAEDLEASISHTTETSEIVKETQKPIIKESEISDASTLVPEEKDYTTQSPLHEDHYTKSPEKESETKKPTLHEVSEIDQTSTRIPEDIHESSQHPGQSDVTLKPINESQEDTDQSSEEIEGTDHSSEENEGTDHSSEEIEGTTDSHGERDQMPTTTVKSLLDIIKPTDATEHGIIKTTEKSVDEIATEKDFAGITDKPELTKEPETTEKSIDAIPEHDLEHASTLKPDEHDTKKPVDTHTTVQTTFSPISDDEKEASITESTVQEDKTQKPHDESEITTPFIKDADKDIEVTTHYLDSTTIHKQGDEIHTTPKYPDVHSAYNKTELPHHGEEGSGSTELPHPDVTTVSEITEKHTESLIPSSTIAPIQHELTPSNDTNSSQDDEKIIPSIHDRYPDTESSTDDISQAVVPHLPSPDQDEDHHQMPQIPDFPGSYGSTATEEEDYPEEDQPFGPGTCRYGGKVYVSAQQIPRDDPCDFCFCFRSDIICLQQSCPPPIQHCHEEPISGFCCPRYECPVSMATVLNVTTTTTTTTTTLPPHFLSHAYKGAAQRQGCQIKGQAYKVGEVVQSASGPCLHCTCGGDGQMKCDPKVCTPEPMLRQMIAVAATTRRR